MTIGLYASKSYLNKFIFIIDDRLILQNQKFFIPINSDVFFIIYNLIITKNYHNQSY
jgi:hypothetical protein